MCDELAGAHEQISSQPANTAKTMSAEQKGCIVQRKQQQQDGLTVSPRGNTRSWRKALVANALSWTRNDVGPVRQRRAPTMETPSTVDSLRWARQRRRFAWSATQKFIRRVPNCCEWDSVRQNGQTVHQGADRSGCPRGRKRGGKVRRAEVEEVGNQARMTAHGTRSARMEMTILRKTHSTWATREKMFRCVWNARGAVWCSHPAVAYKGISGACQRKPLKTTLIRAQCTSQFEEDHVDGFHQVVEEDDDSGEDHQIQQVLGSTVHVSVFWNDCSGRCRTCWLGRIPGSTSWRVSRLISRIICTASE